MQDNQLLLSAWKKNQRKKTVPTIFLYFLKKMLPSEFNENVRPLNFNSKF
jgi:hypothetical protein